MKKRLYICHTYYHVYIAHLKEMALPSEEQGNADVYLSTLSSDFEDLKERMEHTQFFDKVYTYYERRDTEIPELAKYRIDTKNPVLNLVNRIIFTKKYGKAGVEDLPTDLRTYDEIYVFCDSDPVGFVLNYLKIPYHAVEDGLNCIKWYDTARYDNRGNFQLKALLSSMNLIFIQNGYGKYCLDMEVNDISALKYPCPKYKEVPRVQLTNRLTKEDKEILLKTFVRDIERLQEVIKQESGERDKILILTEPLCTLDVREIIFKDIIKKYGQNAMIFMKPHPRDELNYEAHPEFKNYILFDKMFPMEILNYFETLYFDKVISVFTVMDAISFTREKVMLGKDFMDDYEQPEIHRQNEQIF